MFCLICLICKLFFSVTNKIFFQKMAQSSDSASASTSATASTTTSNEIEELEQKLLSGEDFSLKELTETELDVLWQIFSKYLITSSLKLAKDIIPPEDQSNPEKLKKIRSKICNSKIEMLEKML